MHDIVIIETPQHMKNGISFTDICKELVSKTFAFACTFHETCDIHDVDSCRHYPLRVAQVCKSLKSFVRNICGAEIRLDRTKRKIGALGLSRADTVEQCRLAHVRQSYNTAFK